MQLLLAQKFEIAELIAVEQGKPVLEALAAEVIASLAVIESMIREGPKQLRPRPVSNGLVLFAHKKSRYLKLPYGVVAVISPWNYPFSVPLPQIVAALIAGNTVVFKPAPTALLTAAKIDELFTGAGFPPGVVNTLFLHNRLAPELTAHPGVAKIVFTGSTRIGAEVMRSAAGSITPVLLELGGKDPAVVARDADLLRAARGLVWGSMFTSGQVCASVERVYVERPVAGRFISLCLEHVRELVVGDPLDPDTDIGPLSSFAQRERIADQVADAVERGAECLHGGRSPDGPGFFYPPTLLTGVDHTMRIMREETFGPVMAIQVVEDLDQAIALANDSLYGLSAYGWTRSPCTARRLISDLDAGSVIINDSTFSWGEPKAPWGGMKRSGIGRMRAEFGLDEMVQIKYSSSEYGSRDRNRWWFPYDSSGLRFFAEAADLLFRRHPGVRLRALLRALTDRRFLREAHWGTLIRRLPSLLS